MLALKKWIPPKVKLFRRLLKSLFQCLFLRHVAVLTSGDAKQDMQELGTKDQEKIPEDVHTPLSPVEDLIDDSETLLNFMEETGKPSDNASTDTETNEFLQEEPAVPAEEMPQDSSSASAQGGMHFAMFCVSSHLMYLHYSFPMSALFGAAFTLSLFYRERVCWRHRHRHQTSFSWSKGEQKRFHAWPGSLTFLIFLGAPCPQVISFLFLKKRVIFLTDISTFFFSWNGLISFKAVSIHALSLIAGLWLLGIQRERNQTRERRQVEVIKDIKLVGKKMSIRQNSQEHHAHQHQNDRFQ